MKTETLTIAQEAAALRELKLAAAEADATAKQLKAEAQDAEMRLFERMEQEGVESIKHAGTLYVPTETVYGQVQDRSAFITWAEEHAPELLETKERKALVNEVVRDHLDTGAELPAGLGYYVKTYISQRSG